jgi:hypothetical protein
LPPSAAFQQSVSWWQSERGLVGFAFSLCFSRSASVEASHLPVQSAVVLPSGFFPVWTTLPLSQTAIVTGGDSNTTLKIKILVEITVGGLVIIVGYHYTVGSPSVPSSPETLIQEPETVDTNSGFWEFSHDFTTTTEWGPGSVS